MIDRFTWFAFIASNLFGMLALLVSASMPIAAIKIFDRLHVVSSMAWSVFLVTHLVLHQKWIVSALKRFSPFHEKSSVILNQGRKNKGVRLSDSDLSIFLSRQPIVRKRSFHPGLAEPIPALLPIQRLNSIAASVIQGMQSGALPFVLLRQLSNLSDKSASIL
jgi:hypothetical protein